MKVISLYFLNLYRPLSLIISLQMLARVISHRSLLQVFRHFWIVFNAEILLICYKIEVSLV